MAHQDDALRHLADTIREVVESAGTNTRLPANELQKILLFIGKVCDVIEQTFRDVYAVLLQIKVLDAKNPDRERILQLHSDLQLLQARDKYRDAELICGRLHALRDHFRQHIEPVITQLHSGDRWRELFWLIDDREGRVIMLVQSIVHKLDGLLDNGGPADISKAKTIAKDRAEEVRAIVIEMQEFNNGLLGISGQEGWLELVDTDRAKIAGEVALVFQHHDNRKFSKNVLRVDNNSGAIAVGTGSIATSHVQKMPLEKADVNKMFDAAIAEIRRLKLPNGAEESAVKQLDVAKEEAGKANPDFEYVGKTLEKATDTVKKAGGLVTATTALGKLLVPFAQWIGILIS